MAAEGGTLRIPKFEHGFQSVGDLTVTSRDGKLAATSTYFLDEDQNTQATADFVRAVYGARVEDGSVLIDTDLPADTPLSEVAYLASENEAATRYWEDGVNYGGDVRDTGAAHGLRGAVAYRGCDREKAAGGVIFAMDRWDMVLTNDEGDQAQVRWSAGLGNKWESPTTEQVIESLVDDYHLFEECEWDLDFMVQNYGAYQRWTEEDLYDPEVGEEAQAAFDKDRADLETFRDVIGHEQLEKIRYNEER